MSRSSEVEAQGACEGEGGLRLRRVGLLLGERLAVGDMDIEPCLSLIGVDGIVFARFGLAVVFGGFLSWTASGSEVARLRFEGLGGVFSASLVLLPCRNWFSFPLKLVSLLTGTSGTLSCGNSSQFSEAMGLDILVRSVGTIISVVYKDIVSFLRPFDVF